MALKIFLAVAFFNVCFAGSYNYHKPEPRNCYYNRQIYLHGQKFPAPDGCNQCVCENGEVSCTEALCSGCYYNGRYYNVGQRFRAIDGCNTCTCLENGQVGCTYIDCNERPGTCPVSFAGALTGSYGPQCRFDPDCPPPQKCCYNIAGQGYCTSVGKRY